MFIIYKLHTKHGDYSYSLSARQRLAGVCVCSSVSMWSQFACKYTMDLFIRRFWLMMTKQYYLFRSFVCFLLQPSSTPPQQNCFLFINKCSCARRDHFVSRRTDRIFRFCCFAHRLIWHVE